MIDQRDFTRIFSSFYVEAKLAKGLTYKLLFGPDLRYRTNGVFQGSKTNARRNGDSAAREEKNQELGYTLENLFTYDTKMGDKHDLKLTFLQSIQSQRYDFIRTDVLNLPYETQLWYNLGSAGTIAGVSSGLSERSLASFMGRINYAFADKYLIQLTYRTDGSSVLAEGNKWASFPGASVGWRVIDENFMGGTKSWLNELKFRASYGEVGNQAVNPYQTAGRLERSYYDWDGSGAAGFRLWEIPNPNLGWEISKTIDVGVDFGFFDGRLSGTFDWYNTNTEDLLLARNLPITSGYASVLENVGSTETSGIELGLSATIFDTQSGFRWILDGNITHYTEAIRELALKGPNGEPIDDVGSTRFIGEPLRVFYDYKKIGIWQADEADEALAVDGSYPGEIKVADLYGPKDADGNLTGPDGKISGEDRVILGSDVPDVFGGINNRFEWKGFDLSIFFYFRLGHMIQSDFHSGLNTMQGRYNNMDVDYWTIDNPTNAYPRPNFNQESPQKSSTLRYFDGSYWKLRNVVLGYNFSGKVLESLHMSGLRLYATAQNPWFSAKYNAFDPENSGSIGTSDVPSSKLYMLGINVQF
jgi:TonB-linked SusC/RagA family outer membrane protein